MEAGEIDLLQSALDAAELYLEFGSGGSTVEAAKRTHLRTYSVEANKKWIATLERNEHVQAAIAEKRLSILHADIGPVGAWSLPVNRNGTYPWENYCLAVWQHLPRQPDLVLIDGRFRLACCILSCLACPAETKIMVHDFKGGGRARANYRLATELADVEDSRGSLVVLKRKPALDSLKALALLDIARKDFW